LVDALNRRVHELHATTISMYQTDLKEKKLEAEKDDTQYIEMVTKLQQGRMLQKIENYSLEVDGILLYMNKIYVPNSHKLRSMILKEMHNVPYVGHPRYQKNSGRSQEPLLLDRNEEINCRIHRQMYGVSKGQN
jgi:hypothetical protein